MRICDPEYLKYMNEVYPDYSFTKSHRIVEENLRRTKTETERVPGNKNIFVR